MVDETLACPACGEALAPRGERLFCAGCAGVMVTTDELVEMLRSIYPDEKKSLAQQLQPIARSERTCPHCRVKMDAFTLQRIPIDQCFTHGFWFDRDELEQALQGENTVQAFIADYERRQFAADQFELGMIYAAIRRALRRRARKALDQPSENKPAT